MLRPLLSALTLLALACGSRTKMSDPMPAPAADTQQVTLRLDRATYRAGETITLTVTNASQSGYTFNPCTRRLERREGTGWVPAEQAPRICTMEAWLLPAAGSVTASTTLPNDLQGGEYRVLLALTKEGGGGQTPAPAEVVSERFAVHR